MAYAMPPGGALLAVVLLGLCLGSFATALAWRLPRGLPWVRQRSACTRCGHPLSFLDLVPLVSWLALRGKCRYCGGAIGRRYVVLEVLTMGLCLAFYGRYGLSWPMLPIFLLPPVLLAAIDIDFRHKIIPDILNATVLAAGIMLMVAQAWSSAFLSALPGWLQEGLLGALLYGGGSYLLRQAFMWYMKREALGLGDVKLFAAIGFWFGTNAETFSWFLLGAGLSGVAISLLWRRRGKEAEFPFGPAIIFSFVCVLLWRTPYFLT